MIPLRPLPPKGTIGITAPSSPVDEDRLHRGAEYLEKMGYRVHISSGCYKKTDYLAGSARARAEDLMSMVKNPGIDTIFFARGGFGSMAMLPHLDFDAIASARKLLVGYSDITALQWGIYAQCQLPSLSAGMVASDFGSNPVNPQFEEHFWKFMETGTIHYRFPAFCRPTHTRVAGICLPGTLSVAVKLAGTAYLPAMKNMIFVLEDVEEPRHKIEGYLLQARMGGWFKEASGLVLGSFSDPEKETFPVVPELLTLCSRALEDLPIPLASGVPYGHIENKIPFPLGSGISLSLGRSVTITSTHSVFTGQPLSTKR